jgi:ABC-type branched-subunit amino acid transport system ATPase component
MTPPVLLANGLSAGYHGRPVIRDIDLRVNPGEVVALLGANGAGKSTTLMTLAGFIKPITGHVEFAGRATKSPVHVRAKAGMAVVADDRSVLSRLTVAENFRAGRCDPALACEIFPELKPLMGRKAALLSGGEQQMLTLGRAIARKPTVMLLDELSLGLAPIVVRRLVDAVRQAAADFGAGVLLVEQHVGHALRVADRVYVMRRGSIVLQGTSQEVGPQLHSQYLN